MTKNKRFRMTETELIFMVLDNETPLSQKEIVDKLNNFNDENEQLKKDVKCHEERIAILIQLLDLADTIIDLGDDETTKEFWEKMNDNMDSKWGELNKKAKRDYTSGGIYDD